MGIPDRFGDDVIVVKCCYCSLPSERI